MPTNGFNRTTQTSKVAPGRNAPTSPASGTLGAVVVAPAFRVIRNVIADDGIADNNAEIFAVDAVFGESHIAVAVFCLITPLNSSAGGVADFSGVGNAVACFS